MQSSEKTKVVQRTTTIGAIINVSLSTIQLVGGVLFGSSALILDGIHSLSDLFTDFFVLLVTRFGHAAPDEDHPYGHGRFETMGVVVLGCALVAVAFVFAWNNFEKLRSGQATVAPDSWAIIPPILAIVSKEILFRHTKKMGEIHNSKILQANAWHHRSDVLSSIVVLVGVAIASTGIAWMDSVAAIGVAGFIAKIGFEFIWDSIKELVDTALEPELVEKIQKEIESSEGVKGAHNLRSRMVGDAAMVDVNIEVSPMITVSEGHEIATRASKNVLNKFPLVGDVTAHTDVEHDHEKESFFTVTGEEPELPCRRDIESIINPALKEANLIDKVERLQIHYIGNEVEVDILLNNSCDSNTCLSTESFPNWLVKVNCYRKL